jgi:hypothetical protein
MRIVQLMDGRVIGIGFAANVAVLAVGFSIVGIDPSDTELNVIFGLAFIAGFVAGMAVVHRDVRRRARSRDS